MRKTILCLFFALLFSSIYAESPHGKGFKMDCGICHNPEGWKFKEKGNTFNHNKTHFPLLGQHKMVNCRLCHPSLVFSEAPRSCVSCHKDMHQGTVGPDCESCHNNQSWIVPNIRQMHQRKGFSLVGAHATADCNFCHKGASQLRFENIRSECVACHKSQYDAAMVFVPGSSMRMRHSEIPVSGDKLDCYRCHNLVGRSWNTNGKGFEHGFFPLKGGHANVSCDRCHYDGFNFKPDRECSSCHSSRRAVGTNPAHSTLFKNHNCSECHNIYSWNSVKMKTHVGFRGGMSKHSGVGCNECHTNDANYKSNCRKCHNFDD